MVVQTNTYIESWTLKESDRPFLQPKNPRRFSSLSYLGLALVSGVIIAIPQLIELIGNGRVEYLKHALVCLLLLSTIPGAVWQSYVVQCTMHKDKPLNLVYHIRKIKSSPMGVPWVHVTYWFCAGALLALRLRLSVLF